MHANRAISGFTLLELMVTVSAMTIIGSMGMVALQSANSSANVARAKSEASAEARAVVNALAAELQLAQKDDSGGPAIAIVEGPFNGCAMEFAFTLPGAGSLKPRHVRYQYMFEDRDDDGEFDEGEDTLVADGRLSGRVVRVETVDSSDGEAIDVTTIVGGAHDLRDLSLDFQGNLLKIVATSAKPIAGTNYIDPDSGKPATQTIETSSVARVYLMN